MRKILIDKDIPYLEGVFEPYFEVERRAGNDFSGDADAWVVRTRTRCDQTTLEGSRVQLIATATIGTDHIDLDYCKARNIEVASAAGCNARAVAQWVGAALRETGFLKKGVVLGVVGVGNVGSEVVQMAEKRGLTVLKNDPPKGIGIGIEELLEKSDVVTLHVPLDASTRGMVDAAFLAKMKQGTLLVNSSRGEVVDPEALKSQRRVRFALDVWPNEPDIDPELVERAEVATPHVAGYSARGKARASASAVRAVAGHFLITPLLDWNSPQAFELEEPENYDIMLDDSNLRNCIGKFEQVRRIREK